MCEEAPGQPLPDCHPIQGATRLETPQTDRSQAIERAEALDPRTPEALPWLLLTFPDLDWDWLLPQVKQRDLQNRLGYVVSLARNVAHLQGLDVARVLEERETLLERSRLVREDVFGRSSLTDAERRWLRSNRPPDAAHWNILSDLRPEHIVTAAR